MRVPTRKQYIQCHLMVLQYVHASPPRKVRLAYGQVGGLAARLKAARTDRQVQDKKNNKHHINKHQFK
jgi:hypothetical protein